MWGQISVSLGHWNPLVWIFFFLIICGFVLWVRSFGRMDYKRNSDQDEIYWSGNEVPEDGAEISVPASASYWGFRVAMEPLYRILDTFHSGNASDYAGYFVVTVALIGLLVLL